jgi:hypothetical protein
MLPDWLPLSLWDEFKKNRKKLRAPMTEYGEGLILAKLDRWKMEGADPIAILNESIEMGWRGVFLNGHAAKPVPAPVKSNKIRCRLCESESWTSLSGGKCGKCRGLE